MEEKKKTPVATGGQETTTGWDAVASGPNDTTVVSLGQQEDLSLIHI